MKIPNKIKIGGFVYTVERPEGPFTLYNKACDGSHDYEDQEICVSMSGTEAYQNQVFIHELCHGIVQNYTLGIDVEESFVEQFSKGLYQVIVDNPEVFGKK